MAANTTTHNGIEIDDPQAPWNRTECEGCWEDGCAVCAPTSASNILGRWVGRPSSTHAVKISALSAKQASFIASLASGRELTNDQRIKVEAAAAGELDKTKASELIDSLKGAPMQAGKTGASEKQESFIRSLVADRECGVTDVEAFLAEIKDRKAASAVIDTLKQLPKRGSTQPGGELEDGMYRLGDDIYKVYHTVHGANQQVAKILVVVDGEGSFEYVGKRPLRNLTPDHKMTLEEAKAFGRVYGVCCNCSATLTREESIEAGIGPICAQRF